MIRKTKTSRRICNSRKNKNCNSRKNKNCNSRNKKYLRKMTGGNFSMEEKNQLINYGFTQEDINMLEEDHPNLNYNIVLVSLQQNNPNTGLRFTPEELIQSINDIHNENVLDISDISDVSDVGSEHNFNNDSLNTTRESLSSLDSLDSLDDGSGLNHSDLDMSVSRTSSIGGKKRKTRKTHKQKGGMCYGTGVGANCNDPNYSIYNTRELQLFPYKPTN